MNPFRCYNCNKLLGMIEGKVEIRCPRCKTMNTTDNAHLGNGFWGAGVVDKLLPLQHDYNKKNN